MPAGRAGDLNDALWGVVPIVCELDAAVPRADAQGAAQAAAPPASCSFMVPRQGYLFLALDHIKAQFVSHIAQEGALWLSHDGVALPCIRMVKVIV